MKIDDIFRVLFDYAGEALGLPYDAKPIKFRLVQGKLQIMLEADSWDKNQSDEEIRFDLNRVYQV